MHAAHNNPSSPPPPPPPEAPLCCSRGHLSSGLALLQGVLTLSGLWLSLWLFFDDNEIDKSAGSNECRLCISHWGLWMCPPASFWGGVACACMMHGLARNNSHSLTNAYELNVMLAPFSVAIFVLLACRSISDPNKHLECTRTAMGLISCTEFSITLALSLVMQAQAAACVCGAMVVQAARRRIDERNFANNRLRLKSGWRFHLTADSTPFYSHKKTGRVQWEAPECDPIPCCNLPPVSELPSESPCQTSDT